MSQYLELFALVGKYTYHFERRRRRRTVISIEIVVHVRGVYCRRKWIAVMSILTFYIN
jgi:hypothetical protein